MFRWRHRQGITKSVNGRYCGEHGCHCGFDAAKYTQTLASVEPGQKVYICCLSGERRLIRRLSEMGFIPGTHVEVIRRAPLEDPIEFEIRGYLVSLRREEAECVQVKNELSSSVSNPSDSV